MTDYSSTEFANTHQPVLKVLGLGGGGGNAVNRMIELGLPGVDFIVANTDQQALNSSLAPVKIQLGPKITRGLGAGGDPAIGYKAADESRETIREALEGADMVFLTAGMGGGTGTGSIAVAGEVARELGAVTIAVVTTPFSFEMGKRQENAQHGLTALRPNTDTLITIPNDKLLFGDYQHLPMEVTFRLADDVLRQAVQGIAELVTEPGLINVDFSHVRQMMKHGGGALMAIGQSEGENCATRALKQALHHPLLEDISLMSASAIIANFRGDNLSLFDITHALEYVREASVKEVDVVMGISNDKHMEDRAQVILVITGLGGAPLETTMAELPSTASIPMEDTLPVFVDEEVDEETIENSIFEMALAPEPVAAAMANNLDLPAFIRRRQRYNQEGEE